MGLATPVDMPVVVVGERHRGSSWGLGLWIVVLGPGGRRGTVRSGSMGGTVALLRLDLP